MHKVWHRMFVSEKVYKNMICSIIRREILDNLLSLRFILSLIVIIMLFVTSGLVFSYHYKQDQSDYWNNTNNNISILQNKSKKLSDLTFYRQEVWKKPSPLMLFAQGFDKSLPNRYEFNIFEMEYPDVSNRTNYLSSYFNNLDCEFIVSIILSIVAIFITYDSICGEKERGTLRLILSGSVSRSQILLAKYLSAMLTIAIPTVLGLLISMLIGTVSKALVVELREYVAITLFTLISFLYISIFVLLGIFMSGTMKRSTNSIVVLLIIWVVLVILVPSLGRVISNVLYKIPTHVEIERKLDDSFKVIWDQAYAGKFGDNAIASVPNRNSEWVNPDAFMKRHQAFTKAREQIIDGYHNQMISQACYARNFLRFSPTILYQKISETFVGTGINRSIALYEQIKKYQNTLRDYICAVDSKDPDSFHEYYNNETTAQWWNTISHKPVHFDTVPKFQERNFAIGRSLKVAVWDIGLLVLFNLVFFAAAFVSFLKYDVR